MRNYKLYDFAARLNSFKVGASDYWPKQNQITTIDLLKRASQSGLSAADLNYPDHFLDLSFVDLKNCLNEHNLKLNGIAMRYYTDPGFKLGAFTNPDPVLREKAINETKKGIDVLSRLGGNLMILWMGQDGFDYSFQADYQLMWEWTLEAMSQISDHNPNINIAIEYKPNEPRAFSLMPDVSTTLLALQEINRKNTGVVLDFAHTLYADEMPAFSANLINRFSQLLGVHLNDGYGKWDNGLMVGSVHPIQTIELLVELKRIQYKKAIYFDTFPDHSGLDPVAEAAVNIKNIKRLIGISEKLEDNSRLKQAIQSQNAVESMEIIQAAIES